MFLVELIASSFLDLIFKQARPECRCKCALVSSKILPLQMLYAEKVSSIIFDVSCLNVASNNCDFFTTANSNHKHETRFSSSGNYYVQTSRLNQNPGSFSKFAAKLWNTIPNEFSPTLQSRF